MLSTHSSKSTGSFMKCAWEMFQVATIINDADKLEEDLEKNPSPSKANIKAVELAVKEKGEAVAQLKSAKTSRFNLSGGREMCVRFDDVAMIKQLDKEKKLIVIAGNCPGKIEVVNYQ